MPDTDATMTPHKAAEYATGWIASVMGSVPRESLRVLIDHARATPVNPADGFDIPAFVVMSERKTELAYKGVHTREAAESLAGGFDDVAVRGAEDVIRELCEQVARHESVPRVAPASTDGPWLMPGECLGEDCPWTYVAHQHRGTTGEAATGEPYLHTLRCVKDACTEDCPRRHENAEDGSEDRRVDLLADALESAHHAGRSGSDEEVSARDILTRLDAIGIAAGRRNPRWSEETDADRDLANRLVQEERRVECVLSDGTVRFAGHVRAYFDHPTFVVELDDGTRKAWSARLIREVSAPAPLAVGDTVETVAQLAALPEGTVARGADDEVAQLRDYGWVSIGFEVPGPLPLPARVLDLPAATVGSS